MYNAVSLSTRASNLQPLASPIIPTRTLSIQETMETIGIPNNDFSPSNLSDELGGLMAITTHTKVLGDSDGCAGKHICSIAAHNFQHM